MQQLGAGHWAAVARGPPGDAVDALGDFKATFQEPSPLPSDLQVSPRVCQLPSAPAVIVVSRRLTCACHAVATSSGEMYWYMASGSCVLQLASCWT